MAFDGAGSWSFANLFAPNVIIFGVDNSSSTHIQVIVLAQQKNVFDYLKNKINGIDLINLKYLIIYLFTIFV